MRLLFLSDGQVSILVQGRLVLQLFHLKDKDVLILYIKRLIFDIFFEMEHLTQEQEQH